LKLKYLLKHYIFTKHCQKQMVVKYRCLQGQWPLFCQLVKHSSYHMCAAI